MNRIVLLSLVICLGGLAFADRPCDDIKIRVRMSGADFRMLSDAIKNETHTLTVGPWFAGNVEDPDRESEAILYLKLITELEQK